ncbi:MAG: Holliday junction branch migration protein RuvA [Rhodospirillales bacterium]|nr:Holliday junction branch migration protein RuvA [Rhodospirillales bacterium]
MISKLSGLVDSTGDDWAVIDVNGVGYLVFCSRRTLSVLPPPGEAARLFIETHVREDHIHLYGFADSAERDWYRLLSTVQGVGSRVALAILSVLPPSQLLQAIAAQDKAAVSRASGVGPKLAARVVSELKDKAGALALGPVAVVSPEKGKASGGGGKSAEDDADDAARKAGEAASALVNLGYGRTDALGAAAQAIRELGSEARLEAVIRLALSELAPKGG